MKPNYAWTAEAKDMLAEKLKRTLDDQLVDELMRDLYISYDQLLLISNTHEEWEKWRDEMAEARYTLSMRIVPALKDQIAKMTELLQHIDECFSYCPHCDGSGWFPRGPYQDECPTCLGRSHAVKDMSGLLAAYIDVFLYLHPDKPVATDELHDPYEVE